MNKIYVQKRGEVYTVPVDPSTNVPMIVTSVSDDLPGFPFTCTSVAELKASFPNSEFVFLEPKQTESHAMVVPPEIRRQAAELMKTHGVNPPPTKQQTVVIAKESQEELPHVSSSTKQKVEEFLKRLQTALQYASKKHEKKLQDQVAIIEELIREVF